MDHILAHILAATLAGTRLLWHPWPMLKKIGATYYLRRRVPTRYHGVVPIREVKESLHTDSASIAKAKAQRIWAQLIESWEARIAGDTEDAEARLAAAKNLAKARGYRYLTAKDVSMLPGDEFLKRVAEVHATSQPGKPDMLGAAALLGAVPPAGLKVGKLFDAFEKTAKDRVIGKSKDQLRRWRNPRLKALAAFKAAVGDKDIAQVTIEDLYLFRDAWVRRIEEDDLERGSANKDFTYLLNMIKTVAKAKSIKLSFSRDDLEGFRLSGDNERTRPPFSTEWITGTLLAPGALDGLNLEARCILLGMVNTGYRPSEAQGLLPAHIHLDAPIPYIEFLPEGRSLKTRQSRRQLPLLGVSLEAFKACPEGFPRYRDKPGLSATVNKFLRENRMLEGMPEHSLYSLRHSFEDRMLEAGIDERVRRDLMGHSLGRERYGEGGRLAYLAKVLKPVAL